jgi:DNA-binding protein H-NS
MVKPNIKRMSIDELLSLRAAIDEALEGKRRELERQISTLGGTSATRGSSLKGRKIPPKYRDAQGNSWAGRGVRPRWLVAALKKGKKLESFAVK